MKRKKPLITATAALLVTLAWPHLYASEQRDANVKWKTVSAQFGLLDYSKPGLKSGEFAILPVTKITSKDQYYGWVVSVECPPGAEEINWTEITYMPAPDLTVAPGVFEDDPSITIAEDRKSYTTRRGSVCREGMARIDDIYGRESSEPLGEWRIEVWHVNQRLAEFRYTIEAHYNLQ